MADTTSALMYYYFIHTGAEDCGLRMTLIVKLLSKADLALEISVSEIQLVTIFSPMDFQELQRSGRNLPPHLALDS